MQNKILDIYGDKDKLELPEQVIRTLDESDLEDYENMSISNKEIGRCQINVYKEIGLFEISKWYIHDTGMHGKGLGRRLLKETLEEAIELYGEPNVVIYVWNQVNDYVYNFLDRHFFPYSLADRFNMHDMKDTKEAHKYVLNTKLFLDYFLTDTLEKEIKGNRM